MNVTMKQVTDRDALEMISRGLKENERKIMGDSIKSSTSVWVGLVDGDLACVWGVVLPSLMSDKAYLWLWTSDAVKGHPFVFIRRAQIVIRELLEEYPAVIGVCEVGKNNGVRWLKLLGAKFGEDVGGLLPFTIRKA